ncbi:hypothetical protein LFML04_2267 [Leptospirillum ferriphilum ML-04]|uniref:Uncharacterized protein n=1 Tax=Leptospirillum ferriphilum (strain ML-04) TaxID=1048260 RepID=J9ZEW3_LEPFM|nr:hypothetical protein LFML04_2267 [Leptospirillum ferriphilum ML-04]
MRPNGQAQEDKHACTGHPSPNPVPGAHTPPLLRRKKHPAFDETHFLKPGHKIFSAGQVRNFSRPVTGVLCERYPLKLPWNPLPSSGTKRAGNLASRER